MSGRFQSTPWSIAAGIRGLAGAVLAILLCGCDAAPTFVALSGPEVSAAIPHQKIRAKSLQEKHRVTPHATNRELAGRVIEVEGLVALVGRQATGQGFITLHGGPKGTRPIQCLVDAEQPWQSVAPGMVTTIKGQLRPTPPGQAVVLLHAEVVAVDEEQTPGKRVLAEELCRCYAGDHLLAQHEYLEQWAWVTGVVSSVDRVNGMVYLNGSDSAQVQCVPLNADETLSLPIQPGATIVVLGKVTGGDRTRVVLRECLPPTLIREEGRSVATETPRE